MLKHIKYFTLLPCLALLANNTALAQTAKKERWFEVEVILFQQLGDKSLLREKFPDDMPSAASNLRHKHFIELLKPFLKPDTSALKLQLPICGEKNNVQNFFQQAATPVPFYQNKTLAEIATLSFYDDILDNVNDTVESESNSYRNDLNNNTSNKVLAKSTTEQSFNNDIDNSETISKVTSENTLVATDPSNDIIDPEFFEPLTPAMTALVNQAEQEFSAFKFELSTDQLPVKSKGQQRQLCQLSPAVLTQLANNDVNFNANDFMVDNVPNTINAAEDVYSKKPYLLSKNSLKLNDIVKQLRWSKEFKPLLHLGWRLAPKGRNYAIPLHIFAGDNLQTDYKKQFAQYNSDIAAALKKEQQAQDKQPELNKNYNAVTVQQQYQQAVNKRLTEILTQLGSNNSTNNLEPQLNIDELIANLDDNKLSLNINDKISKLEQKYHLKKPQPPLQNWFLDGWFKVHLNHYLYITANMTLLNKTLAEQASETIKATTPSTLEALEPLKLIEFKQDRRVISKEIHYFDNPYLGMIVQIRRHKRPTPPIEDEEQIAISIN